MKNKKLSNKIYLLFVFLISIVLLQLTLVSAVTNLGIFKQNECVNLIQTCSACTYVNISSVIYPNSTQALGQEVMTKLGTTYNYTFCKTSLLGKYIVNGYGDDAGVLTVWAYDFNVTTTGQENNNIIPLFLALGGFIILIFAFVFKNNYLGFMSGILFIVFGIFAIVYGLEIVSDFYTQAIGYVSIGLGLFLFLISAYAAINDTGVNLLGNKEDEGDDF
jgi:hypothetical protein